MEELLKRIEALEKRIADLERQLADQHEKVNFTTDVFYDKEIPVDELVKTISSELQKKFLQFDLQTK